MEEWKEYKLGELCEILDSKRIPLSSSQREKRKGCYPYYGAQGIIDYVDDYIFDGTYLLVAEDGENLKSRKQDIAQLVSGKYWVNNHAHILGSNGTSDIRLLCYILNKTDISGYITGSAQPKLNQANMQSIKLTLPSLPTQQKIADILSSLDDKIEVNRRINEQLEELAGALFKSWFVDFEPFMDGEFVDSELGMIPKGWKVGTLGEYCKVKSGFAFKSSWWQDNGLKVIKIKNITSDGVLDMNDCSYVSSENTLKAKDFKTNVGDLLIAMTGATIGKFCMISSKEEMYVNQRVGKFFLGDNPILKLPFIYCTLKTERVYSEIVNKGQGSAQPNISGSDIENIRIPLPEKVDYLLLFNEKLNSVFEKIIKNQQEIRHLTTLRDTLLPKLMSGEIDVNEVEI